jgi:hypothetical protein
MKYFDQYLHISALTLYYDSDVSKRKCVVLVTNKELTVGKIHYLRHI